MDLTFKLSGFYILIVFLVSRTARSDVLLRALMARALIED